MTRTDNTLFSTILDHDDINGLIDISRYGVEETMKMPATRHLVQALADLITKQTLGHEVESVADHPNLNIDNDEDRPVLSGQAAMMIVPLNPIE